MNNNFKKSLFTLLGIMIIYSIKRNLLSIPWGEDFWVFSGMIFGEIFLFLFFIAVVLTVSVLRRLIIRKWINSNSVWILAWSLYAFISILTIYGLSI